MSVTSRFSPSVSRNPFGSPEVLLRVKDWLVPRLMFGFRLAASVCLTLTITYYLELQNSFWAATTAAIVCQPNLGASLQKGRYRIVGTLTGALVMVALLGLLAQQRDMLILSLALFCGVCGFAAVALRGFASYAAALAGITATIIFADTLNDPTSAFLLSLIRVSEICIGIAVTAFVMIVTDFDQAGRLLAGLLQRTADQVAAGFVASLTCASETDEMREARRAVTQSLAPLSATTDAAIAGSARRHARRASLRAPRSTLIAALVGWRNVGHHPHQIAGDDPAMRAHLAALVRSLAVGTLSRDPDGVKEASAKALRDLQAMGCAGSLDWLLKDATRDVVTYLAATAEALRMLKGGDSEPRAAARPRLVIDDPLLALLAGLRAFAAVLAISAFAVATAWVNGAFAIVFAAVVTLIFVARDDQAPALAKDNALGAVFMAIVGAAIYFAILPALTTLPALLCLLFPLFTALGILQAGTWHPIVFLAMAISALPMLGLGDPISYDAETYFNLCLAIIAGNLTGVLSFVLLPVPGPRLRLKRILQHSFRELRRQMQSAQPTDPEAWTHRLERRLETLPPQTTPKDAGALLSLLAVGQAVGRLKSTRLGTDGGHLLHEALKALAAAHLQTARAHLAALARMEGRERVPAESDAQPGGERVGADIAVIIDAIDRDPHLLITGAVAPIQS
ncbi:FUSC family protein [Segnochrobactrum spirostomi]|uniref:FUSC family protein n=1 Tax=Segnochrobactrum spirostomi TaxID=2608987 RepID=A0A6A7YAP7_9HYPH|nr:FUSC family protein [Segnochrobactrum spirostomi]MQT15031.1 FUSC family protein [Segnochrobactrum spirostomi]